MSVLMRTYLTAGTRYVERFEQMSPRAWALATVLSLSQLLVADAFFWMWMILAVATSVDWVAGRLAIRATAPETFSRKKSREGLYGKALGMVVLALLRSMEGILPVLIPGSIPSSRGIFASIIGIALFIDELDSIDRHRQTLGMPPIPMLSWVIARLRSATGAEQREYDRRSGRRIDSSGEEEGEERKEPWESPATPGEAYDDQG